MGTKRVAESDGVDFRCYFSRQNLGKNKLFGITKFVCLKVGIEGDGVDKVVTSHGLRDLMVTLLIEAGYDDSTITLGTGNRDIGSLRSYHNLIGATKTALTLRS